MSDAAGVNDHAAATAVSGGRTGRKEVLLGDERGRYGAAVVRYGPYLFISGSDGDRSPDTEHIDPSCSRNPERQVHNSYGRIQRRLERCGYGANAVVWLEHFVSSQEYLLLRLALWKQYFGINLCTGGGSEASMAGINMLTTVAVAVAPEAERATVTPPPTGTHQGMWAEAKAWVERAYQPSVELEGVRCAKAVRGGDFVFTIGVRGLLDPETNQRAPILTDEAFDIQVRNCFAELQRYLAPAGLTLSDLVKLDVPLRNVNRQHRLCDIARQIVGTVPFAVQVVGMPLAGTSETDMEGMAVRPGVGREIIWSERSPTRALAVRAGGLVFVSGCSGLVDQRTGELHTAACVDKQAQTIIALDQLEATLERAGTSLDQLLRLDVFVRDIYFADELLHNRPRAARPRPPGDIHHRRRTFTQRTDSDERHRRGAQVVGRGQALYWWALRPCRGVVTMTPEVNVHAQPHHWRQRVGTRPFRPPRVPRRQRARAD